MNLVTIDTLTSNMSLYIGPNNASSIVIGNANCTTSLVGPLNSTGNVSTGSLTPASISCSGTLTSRGLITANGGLTMGGSNNITLSNGIVAPLGTQLGYLSSMGTLSSITTSTTLTTTTTDFTISTAGTYIVSAYFTGTSNGYSSTFCLSTSNNSVTVLNSGSAYYTSIGTSGAVTGYFTLNGSTPLYLTFKPMGFATPITNIVYQYIRIA